MIRYSPTRSTNRSTNRSGNADKRLTGPAGVEQRKRIRGRDGYQCQVCKIAVNQGQCDHVVSLDNGGSNDDSNLQLLCETCHYEKTCRDNGFKVKTGVTADGMPTSKSHPWNT
jgi:5-methylcytosine-specific restriction protein A